MVSGAVRWAHPSRTGSGPQLALALRFCPSLACVLASARSHSPAAEPEQPVAPSTSVARPRSPATPPKWSAHPPSSSRHSPLTVTGCPLPFPPDSRLGPTSPPTSPWSSGYPSHVLPWPALPWRSPVRASVWLGSPSPTPTPTPTYRRSVPASHMCLARLRRHAHASVDTLLQWPADLSARSPRAPRRPFPPAVHADAPTEHPGACLPAPCSPPRPLLAIALPGSLIHVGRPPAMAPSTFLRYSPPCTLTPTAPAGASRKPPLATASTRRATGAPFPQGTRLCAIAPECAALAARWCLSSAVHFPSEGHSP